MLAVIGGSGFYALGKKISRERIGTEFGDAVVHKVRVLDEDVYFIPRHGEGHSIPPHRINYRANVRALMELGASGVITVHACGAISKYRPSDIALIEDFIGLFCPPATLFDDFSAGMRHRDFTRPFSARMQETLAEVAAVAGVKLKKGGIVATTPGPRFETPAEIRALKRLGANLVSMTAAYEMTLLGEAEIDFASIAVATNYAAGIGKTPLSGEEAVKVMKGAYGHLLALIGGFAEEVA
ncbi:MAG: MTAP family purine nucleoside phosphorylase [Candidatus Micrarchaeota archaeon]